MVGIFAKNREMKSFWFVVVFFSLISCVSDSSEPAPSNNSVKKNTSTTVNTESYAEQWIEFKQIVKNDDAASMIKYMTFPMGGDCLPGQILLSKPNNQISALDFATHGGKMLTPEFKELVGDSDIEELIASKNADNRFDLTLKETKTSFSGDVVELTTTYQFKIQGDQIKMVAIYCTG